MLELLNNKLVFSFPEVHPDAKLQVLLHRTLRIPDDGKNYPLPPSMGLFPVRHVDDFKAKVPEKWVGRGGVMVPLYQSEALWLGFDPQFSAAHGAHYPFAIKVATGKVSALTGKKWSKKLRDGDYMVSPGQPWLDGYVVEDGVIRQFVAAPLGLGVTVEEQVTGEAEFGGLQIEVVPMDPAKFLKRFPKRPPVARSRSVLRGMGVKPCSATGPTGPTGSTGPSGSGLFGYSVPGVYSESNVSKGATNYSASDIKVLSLEEAMAKRPEMYSPQLNADSLNLDMCRGVVDEISDSDFSADLSEVKLDMGLAAGGKMVQQVFKDPFGASEWSSTAKSRCYVHMCNSIGWQHLTGSLPPHPPMTSATYAQYSFPWFHHYEDGAPALQGSEKLKGVKSVAQFSKDKKIPVLPENQSVDPKNVKAVKPPKSSVRDGVWK